MTKTSKDQNLALELPEGMTRKSTDELNVIGSDDLREANRLIEQAKDGMPEGVQYFLCACTDADDDSTMVAVSVNLTEPLKVFAMMTTVAFTLQGGQMFHPYLTACAKVVGTFPFWHRVRCAWAVFKGVK